MAVGTRLAVVLMRALVTSIAVRRQLVIGATLMTSLARKRCMHSLVPGPNLLVLNLYLGPARWGMAGGAVTIGTRRMRSRMAVRARILQPGEVLAVGMTFYTLQVLVSSD